MRSKCLFNWIIIIGHCFPSVYCLVVFMLIYYWTYLLLKLLILLLHLLLVNSLTKMYFIWALIRFILFLNIFKFLFKLLFKYIKRNIICIGMIFFWGIINLLYLYLIITLGLGQLKFNVDFFRFSYSNILYRMSCYFVCMFFRL